jgi:2-(1,2-epoxy-1,2-dihydrophenyl)acetyl-CoA isomerase
MIELLQRGLLTKVVAECTFDKRCNEILSELSYGPPLAYAAIKRNLMAAEQLSLAEAVSIEARNMVRTLDSYDCSGARRTFFLRQILEFIGY